VGGRKKNGVIIIIIIMHIHIHTLRLHKFHSQRFIEKERAQVSSCCPRLRSFRPHRKLDHLVLFSCEEEKGRKSTAHDRLGFAF
jgi:hypothetical protein